MMPKTARQALVASLIALHASISICGLGLHAAPGLGHVGPAAGPPKTDSHFAWAKTTTNGADHCPICDHFAQGQLWRQPSPSIHSRRITPFVPIFRTPFAPATPLLCSRSRAPPGDEAWTV